MHYTFYISDVIFRLLWYGRDKNNNRKFVFFPACFIRRGFLGDSPLGAIRVFKKSINSFFKSVFKDCTSNITVMQLFLYWNLFKNSEINADRWWTTYLQLREKFYCSCSITNYSLTFFPAGNFRPWSPFPGLGHYAHIKWFIP